MKRLIFALAAALTTGTATADEKVTDLRSKMLLWRFTVRFFDFIDLIAC